MNLDHLTFPDIGWGYLPAQEDVWAAFRYAQENYNPKSVLEIGYHIGHSTTYQLEIYENAKIVGISPDNEKTGRKGDRTDPELRQNMERVLREKYFNRFQWIPGRTKDVRDELEKFFFDFALLDGSHSYEDAHYDAKTCESLEIPNMLVDNWDQPAVRKAVEDTSYFPLKTFEYTQTFKGKTNTNSLALVTLDLRFNI